MDDLVFAENPRTAQDDDTVPMNRQRCPGCGVELPAFSGPQHRYISSSSSCWAAYGEVLSLVYGDPARMAAYRLTADAYAVQHPGGPSAQSIRSVGVHLVSLYLTLERQLPHHAAMRFIQCSAERMHFRWLEPPPSRGHLNVTSVLGALSPDARLMAVRNWAESAWHAWSAHHPQVRAWVELAQGR